MSAKNVLILGHISSGMGEKTLALKFKKGLEQAGCRVEPIVDIIELLGEAYEPLAELNYALADGGFSVCEDCADLPVVNFSDILLILSWSTSIAALFATGIQKTRFTAVKLYAHHPNERILVRLYEPANLVLAESLLAQERALAYHMPPEKILYLPHSYAAESEHIKPNRSYAMRLAQEQGKPLDADTLIIGCVGRLEYGKNYEFAVEAIRRLVEQKRKVALILKGNFPENSPYPDYKPMFLKMLESYGQEPWLLWDKTHTPYPEVLNEYASFDLLLHPSGAEGASHVVIECLGLHKPTVVLDCSSNPYLFKGLATFVKTTGELRGALLPFYIPDLDALCDTLHREHKPPNKALVQDRFHESILKDRVPLLFDPDPNIIKKLYAEDRKLYSL